MRNEHSIDNLNEEMADQMCNYRIRQHASLDILNKIVNLMKYSETQ